MLQSLRASVLAFLLLPILALCQVTDQDGYSGYKLDIRQDGDPLAMVYETENTKNNASVDFPAPDVFLNASVHVGEIHIEVLNLTAKINLDAQILQLLSFNAGVDLSIDRVNLLIQNVTARVLLEARLANLVLMINDTLSSIDLNPIIAELGNGLGTIINATDGLIDGITPSSETDLARRSLDLHQMHLANNILYSIDDYSGSTHTNRILAQNGDLIDQSLDNSGRVSGSRVVGKFDVDMRFNGFNETVEFKGERVYEEEYVYEKFPGLVAVCGVFRREGSGEVVGTQVIAEARGGGSATIASKEEV